MKLVKKWLFPALTCLIVAGAAVLPPLVSQARDVRLLGQVHAELLDADALPAVELPTLTDRMTLYADRFSYTHPVLSFRDYGGLGEEGAAFPDQEPLVQATRELLTGSNVLPDWFFEEESPEGKVVSRLLLWDPAASDTFQEPAVFWELGWSYSNKLHSKDLMVYLDAVTGLPVYLWVFDTNISQWLPYDTDHLRTLAERFFGLLGLDIREIDYNTTISEDIQLSLRYSVAGTAMVFDVIRTPTGLTIELDQNRRNLASMDSGSVTYDG